MYVHLFKKNLYLVMALAIKTSIRMFSNKYYNFNFIICKWGLQPIN